MANESAHDRAVPTKPDTLELGGCAVEVYPTPDRASQALLGRILETSKVATARHGNFVLVVPGGRSFLGVWKLLVKECPQLDLSKWQVFWTDEHAGVPHSQDWNNYRTAWEEGQLSDLVQAGCLTELQLHRIRTQDEAGRVLGPADLREEAKRVANLLAEALGERPGPDLLILGMGADGHTASILPCSASPPVSLLASDHLYDVWDYADGAVPKSHVRISTTITGIRAARQVVLVAFGCEKAKAARVVLTGAVSISSMPASVLREVSGVLVLDEEAASDLPRRLTTVP